MKKNKIALLIMGTLAISSTLAGCNFEKSDIEKKQTTITQPVKATEQSAVKTQPETNNIKHSSQLKIEEGVHYEKLKEPLDIPKTDNLVISEFFWLGCGHCQVFAPMLERWDNTLSKTMDVDVITTPAPGNLELGQNGSIENDRWTYDARVFYALKELGGTQKDVLKMLSLYKDKAIKDRQLPSPAEIVTYFNSLGFDGAKAMELMKDEALMMPKLKKADVEFMKTGGEGTPVFIVDGLYKVKFNKVKSDDDVLEIFTQLHALKNKESK